MAKMHYRTQGRVKMPITIRVPFGGGIGSPEHHSESPEAYFTHTSGLRVISVSDIRVPSTIGTCCLDWLSQSSSEPELACSLVYFRGSAAPSGRCWNF